MPLWAGCIQPQWARILQVAQRRGLHHFGFHVPASKWRKVLARLRRAGVPVQGRRGRAAVYIEDPSGYTVELYKD